MRQRRVLSVLVASAMAALTLSACGTKAAATHLTKGTAAATTTTSTVATDASGASPSVADTLTAFPKVNGAHIITMQAAHSYTPHAPKGSTDDYHCTLVNPHLTANSYIVGTHFYPNSDEVHHAILFEVPPNEAAAAEQADKSGKGWTCFGETVLPGQGLASLGATPWLAAWAPGHGLDTTPAGTGVYFPKGSLVVMQVHYNLLAGDKPVHVKLELQTVPSATHHLTPLHLDLLPAPPDIPCPKGVHGALCNRAAALKNIGEMFGQSAISFVNLLESVCGRNPADPPAGDSTSCTWPIGWNGTILRITPHMHLLGVSMKVTLNPGTPGAKVLLDDKDYDFDYQKSFDITPTKVVSGDHIEVSCTYNPVLRQELPQLRRLPARFVTWGDGTAEEMCLGIISYIDS